MRLLTDLSSNLIYISTERALLPIFRTRITRAILKLVEDRETAVYYA